MGKLITIVGNCGTGKTTLARRLCEAGGFHPLLEQHQERPFQAQFSDELKGFSLSNQIDYLLFRAEQETYARNNPVIAVQDGGLDQDFHVFTRLFHSKGYLDQAEFQLCERLYATLRRFLPPPDLVIKLSAPKPVLVERRERRQRPLDIVQTSDLDELETLVADWLSTSRPSALISLDTAADDPSYAAIVAGLVVQVKGLLTGSPG